MAGGKATPKKDKGVKVSGGEHVNSGQLLVRGMGAYKAGANVSGPEPLQALCAGKIYFTKKKTPHGKFRTFINILADQKKT